MNYWRNTKATFTPSTEKLAGGEIQAQITFYQQLFKIDDKGSNGLLTGFLFFWNSVSMPLGTHILSLRAVDAAGNGTVIAQISVLVTESQIHKHSIPTSRKEAE
jgi:hypothetical protein